MSTIFEKVHLNIEVTLTGESISCAGRTSGNMSDRWGAFGIVQPGEGSWETFQYLKGVYK